MSKRTVLASVVCLAAAFAAGYGVNFIKAKLFPWRGPEVPPFDRVTARTEVPCPAPGPRTFVVVTFGQSLGGNWAGERFVGDPGVVNAFGGRCFAARDPLLGATGNSGNVWTLIANKLVRQGVFGAVVLVSLGRNDNPMAIWRPGASGGAALADAIRSLGTLRPSALVVQQGQTDRHNGTSFERYDADIREALRHARQVAGSVPIFVSQEAGFCGPEGEAERASPDNPVVRVQRAVINESQGVFSGPEVDAILPLALRYDGCHPSSAGAQVLADAWVDIIARRFGAGPKPMNDASGSPPPAGLP